MDRIGTKLESWARAIFYKEIYTLKDRYSNQVDTRVKKPLTYLLVINFTR